MYGFGQHQKSLYPNQVALAAKYYTIIASLMIPSLALSRTSICMFMLHLLRGSAANKKKYFLYFNITLLILTTIVTMSLSLSQCQPATKVWYPEIPGKCRHVQIIKREIYFNGGMFPVSYDVELH